MLQELGYTSKKRSCRGLVGLLIITLSPDSGISASCRACISKCHILIWWAPHACKAWQHALRLHCAKSYSDRQYDNLSLKFSRQLGILLFGRLMSDQSVLPDRYSVSSSMNRTLSGHLR